MYSPLCHLYKSVQPVVQLSVPLPFKKQLKNRIYIQPDFIFDLSQQPIAINIILYERDVNGCRGENVYIMLNPS